MVSRAEQIVLDTLQSEPRGALTPLSLLRERLDSTLSTGTLNGCLWSLAVSGHVNLHRHDYPAGMADWEREAALIVDGNAYIGVALRG